MNKTFREVAAYYKQVVTLTHKQKVTRMYRRSLRMLDSWACDREIFLTRGEEIRKQFEENRHLDPNSGLTQRLVREAEENLVSWIHPDQYTNPYMPGGSRFMRNPAYPLKTLFPHGIPEEFNFATQDIHCIQVPMSAQPEGMQTVLIDPMKKCSE